MNLNRKKCSKKLKFKFKKLNESLQNDRSLSLGGAAFSIIRRRRRIRETMLRLRQFAVEEDQHEDEEEEPDDLDSTLRARALNNHLLYSDD